MQKAGLCEYAVEGWQTYWHDAVELILLTMYSLLRYHLYIIVEAAEHRSLGLCSQLMFDIRLVVLLIFINLKWVKERTNFQIFLEI